MTRPEKYTDNNKNLLTRIRNAYTVGDNPEPENEEMNNLMVKNFINTLAEVSLSIASRKVKETDQ
ncbi:hypothetical protein ACFLUU_04840 [Chloroflexota bacterium]